AKEKQDYKIKNKATARKLFGDEIKISPSQAEKYFSCPFSYFCQKGLNLKKVRKIEFSPLESGTIIHYVLENILKNSPKEQLIGFGETEIEALVEKYLNEFFEEFFEEQISLSKRYLYLFDRLKGLLTRVVLNICEELSQSKFVPMEFEMKIGKDGDIPPIVINIKDGAKVVVEGVVDRVDVFEHGGKRYLRVIDYKSGTKDFDICKIADGFDMQMLLYLFSLCENYKEKEENIPAGVLYLPARDNVISVLRQTADKEISALQEKKLKRSGLVLKEETCLRAMEENLQGRFIPAKEKKSDGFELSKVGTSVATNEEFNVIQDFITQKVAEVGEGLLDGKIKAYPMEMPSFLPCDYCDYRLVCGIEDKDEKNSPKKVSKEKIFDYMKGGEFDE
ncbi:MAG: PD-(D/E)XK nuclease family protein, partial [Oscillospiraceae bacterium]